MEFLIHQIKFDTIVYIILSSPVSSMEGCNEKRFLRINELNSAELIHAEELFQIQRCRVDSTFTEFQPNFHHLEIKYINT